MIRGNVWRQKSLLSSLCWAGLDRVRTTHVNAHPTRRSFGWIVMKWIQTPICWGDFCTLWLCRNFCFLRPRCLCQTLLFPAFSQGTGSLVCLIHPGINPAWREACSWHSPSHLSGQVIPLGMKADRTCGAYACQSCWSQPWQSREYSQWKGMAVSWCWASSACFRLSRVDANRGLLMKCFM